MSSAVTTPPSTSERLATALVGTGPAWTRLANGAAWLGLVAFMVYFAVAGAHAGDAHAYWAADLADPYTTGVNEHDAYLYAPAFIQALAPLKVLPWEAFWIAWIVLNIVVLGWLVGPVVALAVLVPGPYSPVWVNLWYGNIAILMAAALVLVFRRPAAWSFLLLTKVTPGVGLAWFVARRQWRYLAVALGATLAIVIVSFALSAQAWLDWIPLLSQSSSQLELFPLPPLWTRLVAASLIAGAGGWFGKRWTVPLAAVLAQPVFWFTGFTMLVAWLGVLRHRHWLTDDSQAVSPA